jgi:hypothetical protein
MTSPSVWITVFLFFCCGAAFAPLRDNVAERCSFIVPQDGTYEVQKSRWRGGSKCRLKVVCPVFDVEESHRGWSVEAVSLERGQYVLCTPRSPHVREGRDAPYYPTIVCQPKVVVK